MYFVVVMPGQGVTHCSRSMEPGRFSEVDIPDSYRTSEEFRVWVPAFNPLQAKSAAMRLEKSAGVTL